MSNVDNGGPAHPTGQYENLVWGISKREYFAAAALTGLTTRFGSTDLAETVKQAFQIADAILDHQRQGK